MHRAAAAPYTEQPARFLELLSFLPPQIAFVPHNYNPAGCGGVKYAISLTIAAAQNENEQERTCQPSPILKSTLLPRPRFATSSSAWPTAWPFLSRSPPDSPAQLRPRASSSPRDSPKSSPAPSPWDSAAISPPRPTPSITPPSAAAKSKRPSKSPTRSRRKSPKFFAATASPTSTCAPSSTPSA